MITPGDPNWRDDDRSTRTAGRWGGVDRMSSATRIKRGVGVLLVGVLAYVVGVALNDASTSAAGSLASAFLALLAIGFVLVGIALLLWGLLTD